LFWVLDPLFFFSCEARRWKGTRSARRLFSWFSVIGAQEALWLAGTIIRDMGCVGVAAS
jgi:hypothetical protein